MLSESKNDPGLGRVVGRHFHFHFVSHHQPDESLAHFAGDVSQHLMSTGQSALEHRASQNGRNGAFDLHRFLLVIFGALFSFTLGAVVATPTTIAAAATSAKISWSSDTD